MWIPNTFVCVSNVASRIQSSVDHIYHISFSVHICVNRIHWLHRPCAMNATVPWGQDPFLLCSTDSACVSRPRSETTHQGHAKLRKRSRGPTPSKYPCPPVARLQDSATKFDNLCAQQESNCGFQLLELHCYHRAKSVHAVVNPPTEKHTCQTCNKWRNFTRLIYEYESTSLRLVQTLQ